MKRYALCLLSLSLSFSGYSQIDSIHSAKTDTLSKDSVAVITKSNPEIKKTPDKKTQVYKMNACVDIPIIAIGTGWSLYAFTKIWNKSFPTPAQILSLKKSDVNAFDRSAFYPYNKSLDRNSYYTFYAAMPLPLIFFLTEKETRSDYLKLTCMYWEAMAVTGFFGSGAVYFVDRYRPYTYFHDENGAIDNGGSLKVAKNSFYAGHVETVAVPTFLIAKVYADYHPESKIKWVFYGAASLATGATAYMRLKGGMHFASDVLVGTATGTLAGILVPQLHKKRLIKDPRLSFFPFTDGEAKGLTLIYTLK